MFPQKRKSLDIPCFKGGFTGKREDSLGRTRCYHQGVLVPCGTVDSAGSSSTAKPNQSLQERPASKKPLGLRKKIRRAANVLAAGTLIAYLGTAYATQFSTAYTRWKQAKDIVEQAKQAGIDSEQMSLLNEKYDQISEEYRQAAANRRVAVEKIRSAPVEDQKEIIYFLAQSSPEDAKSIWSAIKTDGLVHINSPANGEELVANVKHMWKYRDWMASAKEFSGDDQTNFAIKFWPRLGALKGSLGIGRNFSVSDLHDEKVRQYVYELAHAPSFVLDNAPNLYIGQDTSFKKTGTAVEGLSQRIIFESPPTFREFAQTFGVDVRDLKGSIYDSKTNVAVVSSDKIYEGISSPAVFAAALRAYDNRTDKVQLWKEYPNLSRKLRDEIPSLKSPFLLRNEKHRVLFAASVADYTKLGRERTIRRYDENYVRWLESVLFSGVGKEGNKGFTGRKEDVLGRTRCYNNGVLVPCEQGGGQQQQGKPQQQAPAQAVSALSIPDDLVQRILNVPEESKPYLLALAQIGQTSLANNPELSAEQKQLYGEAYAGVIANLPPAAMEMVNANLKDIKFLPTTKEVGLTAIDVALQSPPPKELVDMFDGDVEAARNNYIEQLQMLQEGLVSGDIEFIAAFMVDGSNTLLLDGVSAKKGQPLGGGGDYHGPHTWNDPKLYLRHVYAHEIGHVIDGRDFKLSHSDRWVGSWYLEIQKEEKHGGPRLTQYAATASHEGFAEFCRILYSSDSSYSLGDVEKHFPHCSRFFKENGLWPVA